MLYKSIRLLTVLLFFLMLGISEDRCAAQDFPYMVPEAPEFDSTGSVGKTPTASPPVEQKKPVQSNPGVFKPKLETGAMIPTQVPEAPLSNNEYYPQPPRSGPVRGPSVESPPVSPSAQPQRPVASVPQRGPGAGTHPQSDCSEFPMLIARSKSDTEMQMTARHYLTCLIQGGWTMDQAREQVIRTIETAYRPGR